MVTKPSRAVEEPTATHPHSPVDPEVRAEVPMTHREILTVMSGLLLAMFVAMLSSTIVTNALPSIVVDLDGGEAGYTWVVVATLLTMTASTPIWGKLADLVDKKRLVQVALVTYIVGSVAAGFAQDMGALIAARAVTGLGVGGMTALVMVVIASIVTPRERGRYSGYIGAVFAMATVSGPLIGGFVVDAPGLGWRWTFWIGVPVALVALVVLQRTLHLPAPAPRAGGSRTRIDYPGALLIVGGVSVLLAWVSLAGHQFDWASPTTALMVVGGLLLLAAAVVVEKRVAEPIIPLRLFADRTTTLATLASVMVGVAMFGSTVYLSQYFQIARGMSPTHAGLMSTPMVVGLFLSSVVTGRVISETGRWKRFLVSGMVAVVIGLGLLSTIDETTSLVRIGAFMVVLGVGLGATMQNLVLAVQNQTAQRDMGAASALVTFFRSIGGSAGVAALGALLGHRVADSVTDGLARLGIEAGGSSTALPDLDTLPGPVRDVFQGAYGDATALLFLVAVPFAVVALLLVSAIREVPLRTTLDVASDGTSAPEAADAAPDASPAAPAAGGGERRTEVGARR
ncbi:MDR family MFS transporter [Nocardioides sp. ChNu-153]|uniref:MDR family MFS transporter n=1 Tax=Nocardioides sp. ChNu-153 TaxID=2779364 RepID=UPI003461F9E1